jgi:putative salt-induced outer membrane protein YdiY
MQCTPVHADTYLNDAVSIQVSIQRLYGLQSVYTVMYLRRPNRDFSKKQYTSSESVVNVCKFYIVCKYVHKWVMLQTVPIPLESHMIG